MHAQLSAPLVSAAVDEAGCTISVKRTGPKAVASARNQDICLPSHQLKHAFTVKHAGRAESRRPPRAGIASSGASTMGGFSFARVQRLFGGRRKITHRLYTTDIHVTMFWWLLTAKCGNCSASHPLHSCKPSRGGTNCSGNTKSVLRVSC
jgi:hypothetical protein